MDKIFRMFPPGITGKIIIGSMFILLIATLIFGVFMTFFLFWPVVVVSVVSSIYGIARRSPVWLIFGALLPSPVIFLYVFNKPLLIFLPICLLSAAFAVHRQKAWLAWLLLILYISFFGWLGWTVITQ